MGGWKSKPAKQINLPGNNDGLPRSVQLHPSLREITDKNSIEAIKRQIEESLYHQSPGRTLEYLEVYDKDKVRQKLVICRNGDCVYLSTEGNSNNLKPFSIMGGGRSRRDQDFSEDSEFKSLENLLNGIPDKRNKVNHLGDTEEFDDNVSEESSENQLMENSDLNSADLQRIQNKLFNVRPSSKYEDSMDESERQLSRSKSKYYDSLDELDSDTFAPKKINRSHFASEERRMLDMATETESSEGYMDPNPNVNNKYR